MSQLPLTPVHESVTALALPAALQTPQNFPVALSPAVTDAVLAQMQSFDLMALSPVEISKLGFDAEMALNKVFDQFLTAIDRQKSPAMFRLMDQLNGAIEAERLDQLADKIISGEKPTLMGRLAGMLSPAALRSAANKALMETAHLVSFKTKNLSDKVSALEVELATEMRSLETEMHGLDRVLQEYSRFREMFAQQALYLFNAHLFAKAQLEAMAPALEADSLLRMQAAQKLQALESRALAVEAGMTRLPADQLMLAQIQDSGMSTLQELATTASSRFASIKSNLLSLYSAYRVLEAQQLGQKGKELDENLGRMRNKLAQQAVTQASNAPGDNRLSQAQQIQSVIASTRELMEIANQARVNNQQKFAQTRELLAASRQEMLELAQSIYANPQARS